MPQRYGGDDPTPSEVDAAMEMIQGWHEEDATPQPASEEVQPSPAYRRSERPRAANGRFASGTDEQTPAEEQPPVEPLRRRRQQAAPQEQAPPPQEPQAQTPQEQVDYAAEVARLRAENERLQTVYNNNTQNQRQALEDARREARELREAQVRARQEERESILTEIRQGISQMQQREQITGQQDPRLPQAERELLALERRYFEDERREAEERATAERQRVEEATRANAELGAKAAAWTTVEVYAASLGQHLNLHPEEVQGVLAEFQTEELGTLIREMPAERVVDFIRHHLGPRVEQRLRSHQAQLLEENRQDMLRSGTHQHTAQPESRPSAPAYEQYTRRGISERQRMGVDNTAAAILAGILDED